MDKNTIIYFEKCKQLVFFLNLNVALPSTIIKLDIALIKVSTVEIVNARPKIIITIDKKIACSFSNK